MKRVGDRLSRDEWYSIPEGATHYHDITPEEGPTFFRRVETGWEWWSRRWNEDDGGHWAPWGVEPSSAARPLPADGEEE